MNGKEAAKAAIEERKIFRRVFAGEDGTAVLAWILNECRCFSQEAQIIDPALTAFCNRLLGKTGIIHPDNLHGDTAARLANANDLDLAQIIGDGHE
ncbi:MAG: hypothetical protein LBG27_00415 [Spirochaetaceae bacterium]|jgi:hypothetical protein|nr:hypothetical protein [Spirochaetaceae bacterium]